MPTRTAEMAAPSPHTVAATPVLLNAASGGAGAAVRALAHSVEQAFAGAGLPASVVVTDGARLPALARQAVADGHAIVVAAGGDGSIGAVAAALAGTGTALGVLPLGTRNHFAKDLGVPRDLAGAVRAIVEGQIVRVDVGDVNGQVFINNSSMGIYPSLVYQREKRQERGRARRVALMLALVRVWRSFRRVRVVVQAPGGVRTVRTPFVFVGNNAYQLEGVRFGARARLDAGVLHLAMAPGMNRGELLLVLARALAGHLPDVDHLDTLLTPEIRIHAWRRWLPVALDGEVLLLPTPLRYRIRPGALRVCIPRGGARS